MISLYAEGATRLLPSRVGSAMNNPDKVESGNLNGQAKPSATLRGKQATTSIWRTYFVSNEWSEIQHLRKTSVVCNSTGSGGRR